MAEPESDEWIELALTCARLQAQFLVEHGRKIVPFSELYSEARYELPMSLYDLGIVELVAWEESGRGKIKRIRRADLSRAAAQALVQAKLLPRCFVPVLVAHHLLDGWLGAAAYVEDAVLIEEFRAWLDCGGLEADRLLDRWMAETMPSFEDHLSRSPRYAASGAIPALSPVFCNYMAIPLLRQIKSPQSRIDAI